MRLTVCFPGRDVAAGAPFAHVFALDPDAIGCKPDARTIEADELRAMSRLFWSHVQSRRLLAPFTNLTSRQRDVLVGAARGYSTAEIGERLGVSLRAAEKHLSEARARLGAPTTAAAIYRATVYRAL